MKSVAVVLTTCLYALTGIGWCQQNSPFTTGQDEAVHWFTGTFEDAKQCAKEEGKVILIDFFSGSG